MKQSFFVVIMFFVGCIVGAVSEIDWDLHNASLLILYALMFQVGISVGCSDNLKEILGNFRPKMLLLPLATVVGTLSFSALACLVLKQWGALDCMAVGGGLGYYSLSSILITELKADTLGQQLATELGAVALLCNVCRELGALVFAPFFARYFGPLAPVTAAGVTSVDVALPAIASASGKNMIPVALFHGMVLDMSVPFLVPFLCEF